MKKWVLLIALFVFNLFGNGICPNITCAATQHQITGRYNGPLNCKVPNQSGADINITAPHVFDYSGTGLIKYWENQNDVCDVVQWIGDAIDNFGSVQGMALNTNLNDTLLIGFAHMAKNEGAKYSLSEILFDIDKVNDHNVTYNRYNEPCSYNSATGFFEDSRQDDCDETSSYIEPGYFADGKSDGNRFSKVSTAELISAEFPHKFYGK